MLRTDFLTSPGEVKRQLEAKPEVDSDDLWLSKFKSKGIKKSKKNGKAGAASSGLSMSDSVLLSSGSGFDSPITRLQTSITQMTGFSPINPTSSLHDEFHTMTPPSNHSALGNESDFQPTSSIGMFSRPPPAPTPLARIVSTSTVSDGPSSPYEAIRPSLFQRALIESINGAKFEDANIYTYSARSRTGKAHRPRAVRARRAFLNAACPRFEQEICPPLLVSGPVSANRSSLRTEYGYDADSDLEDCEEELSSSSTRTSPSTGSPSRKGPRTQTSTALNLSDNDMVSLDGFGSEAGLSDILHDNNPHNSDASRKPSLSLDTNAEILSWRNEQEQRDATPRDAPIDLPSRVSPAAREYSVPLTGEITLFVPDSAHRTWQALLLYLYNDYIFFNPLQSQGSPSRLLTPEGPSCSPKSMYRLAANLGLDELKHKAFDAIEQALSRDNIVKELFSDFTWRYPEVLAMQTNVFYRYSSEATVQAAMSETFQEIAYGQLPHSSIVLSSLFKRFVAAARPQ